MKIYIAGSMFARRRLRRVRQQLREMGHYVLANWLDENLTKTRSDETRRQRALEDLTAIAACECFIVDMLSPSSTGGYFVELGAALALPTRPSIIVVCPSRRPACIFTLLADQRMNSWREVYNYLMVYDRE